MKATLTLVVEELGNADVRNILALFPSAAVGVGPSEPAQPGKSPAAATPAAATPKRGRGRPPGSRNKSKPVAKPVAEPELRIPAAEIPDPAPAAVGGAAVRVTIDDVRKSVNARIMMHGDTAADQIRDVLLARYGAAALPQIPAGVYPEVLELVKTMEIKDNGTG